ncbi:adhesion G-protein coupled receptor G6 [Etheostoma cragini]|uniref:adhesion G-protein coupled receptor G6 n=1 Tax=Etheostoma cragini TaxID=417921 RepID=UPI00155EB6CC|nr:adhesion G-protein coupled receptor G6 [Etheostoma cragini]
MHQWRLFPLSFFKVHECIILPSPPVLGCSSTNCIATLTDAQGEFTSPCYPEKYPNLLTCKWTLQAPAGFIIQLSFLDFDLEEARGCIYDWVVVNTGTADVKFCGLTANGLTLNSTGNVMELSLTSDFSVQKRGFSVSFRHVAVALRNQKVAISGNGQVTEVANSVTIPTLNQLTICFELERSTTQKTKEWIFSYHDSSNNVALSLGADQSGMNMIVNSVVCPIDSIISSADFTTTMKPFCVLWTSSNGRVAVYFNRNYRAKTCSSSTGHSVPAGGQFRLGGQQSFDGNIYNLRLWNYAMTVQELNALSCDVVGNVIDWDNSQWTIPSTVAQTDTTLSCSVTPPNNTPLTTSCDSPRLGCPVLPSISTSASTIPTTSMPLTPTIRTTSTTTSTSITSSSSGKASSALLRSQQATSNTSTALSATTNQPATNPTTPGKSKNTGVKLHHKTDFCKSFIYRMLNAALSACSFMLGGKKCRQQVPVNQPEPLSYQSKTLAAGPNARNRRREEEADWRKAFSFHKCTAQPTSQPNLADKETRPTTQESELLPESGVLVLSQESSPWQRRDEALDTKESASAAGAAPLASSSSSLLSSISVLSNRKNKPVAPQWSLLSMSGGENQTVAKGNWTDLLEPQGDEYSSGSEPFVYDLTELSAESGSFSLFEFDAAYALDQPATILPAFDNPDGPNDQSVNRSDRHEALFYRVSFVVDGGGSALPQADVERAVALWLNQTFQNWTHAVSVDSLSVQPGVQSGGYPTSYTCRALLVYDYIANQSLGAAAVSAQLSSRKGLMGAGLQLRPASTSVTLIENCQEENLLHYRWPASRPTVTQLLPCFPNKEQSTSRTCLISLQNFSSYWSAADISNCTDIDTIQVSAENAAEVAVQLAVITNNELSNEEVSKVVSKVKQLVNVARINGTLASTVVTIISNIMASSETALANSSEGPSSPSLQGKVDFESERMSPLGQVTLPASLLSGVSLSESERSSLSRINFLFFSSTTLFQKEQDGRSLNSFVVASSVGNFSIRNLKEPVEIHIAHLSEQPNLTPVCMFWDFSMNYGAGGWNEDGCLVSKDSSVNTTVCLCDHLTHFGILMDISGTAPHIDHQNNKILTFITYVGCGLSAIFSAATLLTYLAFEKLRRDYPSKILMNLSTALLFLNMVFLLDGWLANQQRDWLCVSVAVVLHYFLLASFTWMGLESVHMYIALVKVFNTYIRRYILKFCILGWGLPAVLVGLVVTVNKNSYGLQEYGKGESGEGSSKFCWIQNSAVFYSTVVSYFCLVFLLNVAMFIVVMMQICGRNGKRSNRTLREEVLRNLRSVISLTFLLGMTWGFALFAWGPVNLAFMYLFSIFNSLQGLFIFIFHCAMKENVQKQWRRYLCCGRFRLSDNSDWSKTATNNTKKVSSDNLGKSLSSSSFGSSSANWTSKAKATLNPFTKRHSNTDKCYSNQTGPKCVSSCSTSSEVEPNSSSSSSSSILPVSQMIDKVKGYCSTRSDNFYKNIIMSDSFANSTRF